MHASSGGLRQDLPCAVAELPRKVVEPKYDGRFPQLLRHNQRGARPGPELCLMIAPTSLKVVVTRGKLLWAFLRAANGCGMLDALRPRR